MCSMANDERGTDTIETRLFINGQFSPSSDGATFPLVSPWTREIVAEVSEASKDDVDRAVVAASAAFPAWSQMSPRQRGQLLKRLASLLRTHGARLARLEAMSMGRPVQGYKDNVVAADRFDYHSEAGWNVLGESSLNTPHCLALSVRQPFGVVAAIIPWNVPLIALSGKLAPALAAGNTVVLKSSEKAPLTSLYFAHLVQEAGFPAGVVNVLNGHGNPSGEALASHMGIRALSFTGSTATGRLIQKSAASSNMKNLIFELGGKSPAIVFNDADIENAAETTAHSIQWNSGQVCMANSRVYVQEDILTVFMARFREAFARVSIGDPTNAGTSYGPLADKAQYDRVRSFIDGAVGTDISVLGQADTGDGAYIVRPTILTNVDEAATIMKEEVFGPVAAINTFKTEEEVIKKANASEYGLYASVFTANVSRAIRCARELEAGTVSVNAASPFTTFDMPFGGWKMSGVSREGLRESLEMYTELKTVLFKS